MFFVVIKRDYIKRDVSMCFNFQVALTRLYLLSRRPVDLSTY